MNPCEPVGINRALCLYCGVPYTFDTSGRTGIVLCPNEHPVSRDWEGLAVEARTLARVALGIEKGSGFGPGLTSTMLARALLSLVKPGSRVDEGPRPDPKPEPIDYPEPPLAEGERREELRCGACGCESVELSGVLGEGSPPETYFRLEAYCNGCATVSILRPPPSRISIFWDPKGESQGRLRP